MSQDSLFSIFNIFLAAGDLDLCLEIGDLLLFPNHHLLVIMVIVYVDTDAELIAKLVNTGPLCTDDTSNIFLVDVKFS